MTQAVKQLFCRVLLVLCALCFQASAQNTNKTGTASIQGKVVRAGTTQALNKAFVELRPVNTGTLSDTNYNPAIFSFYKTREGALSQTTNERGEFSFEKIPTGRYYLSSVRDGYVHTEYMQRGENESGAVIPLTAESHLKDLTIPMRPAPTISGTVRDENGAAVRHAAVTALAVDYLAGGVRSLREVGIVDTNDRGEYRLFWLTPGEYYIAVDNNRNARHEIMGGIPQSNPNVPEPVAEYPRFYYPDTPMYEKAVPVRVTEAGDAVGINIKLSHVPLASIRGQIVNIPANVKPENIQIMLSALDRREGGYSFSYRADANGRFEIKDVVPGAYSIRPFPQGAAFPAVRVDIAGKDVENVSISAQPSFKLRGQVHVEGDLPGSTSPLGSAAILWFVGATGRGERFNLGINPDGTLADRGSAFPGDFRVFLDGFPPQYYLKQVMVNSVDVLETSLHVGTETTPPIEITLGTHHGVLSGVVNDLGKRPAAGVLVVLVPLEKLRDRADRYPRATTDLDGRFQIESAPPGNYTALAFEEAASGSWFNPAFLNRSLSRGDAIVIHENVDATLNLEVIPAEK